MIGSEESMGAKPGPAVSSLGSFLPEPVGTRAFLSRKVAEPAENGARGRGRAGKTDGALRPRLSPASNLIECTFGDGLVSPSYHLIWFEFGLCPF